MFQSTRAEDFDFKIFNLKQVLILGLQFLQHFILQGILFQIWDILLMFYLWNIFIMSFDLIAELLRLLENSEGNNLWLEIR